MKKEFVMRGQTASDQQEVLNFSGFKKGYAYKIIDFKIYPSNTDAAYEIAATITAAKTAENPSNPNFNNDGLIATAFLVNNDNTHLASANLNTIVNDTFLITQDLILKVIDTLAGSPMPVNWQCRFVSEKMNLSQEAVANYNQFTISDD